MLSFQEVGQNWKIVVKIEFTPLSLDRKIFPFNPFTTAMTYMSYNEWDTKYNELRYDYNEWDTKCHDWQRITTNDHEWQRMTTNSTIDTRKYVIDTRNHWNIFTAL